MTHIIDQFLFMNSMRIHIPFIDHNLNVLCLMAMCYAVCISNLSVFITLYTFSTINHRQRIFQTPHTTPHNKHAPRSIVETHTKHKQDTSRHKRVYNRDASFFFFFFVIYESALQTYQINVITSLCVVAPVTTR